MPGKRLAGGTLQRTQIVRFAETCPMPLNVDRTAKMVRFVEPDALDQTAHPADRSDGAEMAGENNPY